MLCSMHLCCSVGHTGFDEMHDDKPGPMDGDSQIKIAYMYHWPRSIITNKLSLPPFLSHPKSGVYLEWV